MNHRHFVVPGIWEGESNLYVSIEICANRRNGYLEPCWTTVSAASDSWDGCSVIGRSLSGSSFCCSNCTLDDIAVTYRYIAAQKKSLRQWRS